MEITLSLILSKIFGTIIFIILGTCVLWFIALRSEIKDDYTIKDHLKLSVIWAIIFAVIIWLFILGNHLLSI